MLKLSLSLLLVCGSTFYLLGCALQDCPQYLDKTATDVEKRARRSLLLSFRAMAVGGWSGQSMG